MKSYTYYRGKKIWNMPHVIVPILNSTEGYCRCGNKIENARWHMKDYSAGRADGLASPKECTGKFSDAKDCPVHRPHEHYFKKQDRLALQTDFGFDWYYAECECGCPGYIKIPNVPLKEPLGEGDNQEKNSI